MEHFAAEEWVDLIRGVLNLEDRRRIESHIEAGCPECQAADREWRRIVETGQQECAYQPPGEQVRLARIAFALQSPAQPVSGLVQLAHLMFDSFLQPAVAGLRSLGSAARQVVHQAGTLFIHVQISPPPAPLAGPGLIVGQVLNTHQPDGVPAEVSVFLLQRSRIQQTFANSFGEFHFNLDDNPALWLVIMTADAEAVAVPLAEPLSAPSH